MLDLGAAMGPDAVTVGDVFKLLYGEFLRTRAKDIKNTKTPVRKPKHSPQTEALKNKVNKCNSKVQKGEKKIQTLKYKKQVQDILDRIKKEQTSLTKTFETMEKNKIPIDESQEEKLRTLTTEIDKIKNNIYDIGKETAQQKDLMDQEIKKWKSKEKRARTKMAQSIQKWSSDANAAKEKAKQAIIAAKLWEEDEKINRDIQITIDENARKITTIQMIIEAKKTTLASQKYQCDMIIRIMNEKQAKIDAQIETLKDDIKKKEEEKESSIAAKLKIRNEKNRIDRDIAETIQTIENMKEENEKKFQLLKTAQEKYDKEILHQLAINKEIEAKIKCLEETKAQKVNAMNKEFELLRYNKQNLEKSIQVIKQDEAKKQSGIKAKIKALQAKEAMAKFNLCIKTNDLEYKLAIASEETNKSIDKMKLKMDEIIMHIQNKSKQQKEIENNIKEMVKNLEVAENKLENRIVSLQQLLTQQEIEIAEKIKTMQKRVDEKTKDHNAALKKMQEKEAETKIQMDQTLKCLESELAKKKAEHETYIQDETTKLAQKKTNMETNTAILMEQSTAEETIKQLVNFMKAATKDSIGRALNHCNHN